MKEKNRKITMEERVRIQEENLKRVVGWINSADAKVATILVFQAGLLAFLVSRGGDVWKIWAQNNINNNTFLFFLSLIVFGLSVFISIYKAFRALFPDVTLRGESSLLFFGSISKFTFEEFKNKSSELNQKELEIDLLNQVYINSQIASFKFKFINISMKWLIVTVISWTSTLVFLSVLG